MAYIRGGGDVRENWQTQESVTATALAPAPAPVAAPAPAPVAAPAPAPVVNRDMLGTQMQATAAQTSALAKQREQALQQAINAWRTQQSQQSNALAQNIAAQQQGLGQRSDIQMLQQAAMGQGPSAAAIQAQQQGNQIAAQQYALAASRGANPAAIRAAVMSGGEAQQAAAGQAALARAQEQMAARGQYAQAYGQGTEALLGAQMQAAGLQQQGGLGGLQALQGAAGLGQQGQLAGQEQLMNALNQRYAMGSDVEKAQLAQTLQKMQADAQLRATQMQGEYGMAQTQAQIDAQPGFWEKALIGGIGGITSGIGGGIVRSVMS